MTILSVTQGAISRRSNTQDCQRNNRTRRLDEFNSSGR